jgi:tetratricopeptide (TPR) repeat protein
VSGICLNMIVKDEAENIERCLASVRDHVSAWVIVDTGSTDGTQDLVRAALEGIPGELHERPWVNFAHNRSEALRLARGKAEYVLILDADWTLNVEPGALDDLTADSYMIRHVGSTEHWMKALVRDEHDWFYVGAVHEYIDTRYAEERSENLLGVSFDRWGGVGGDRTGRWERDLELLTAEVERDPDDTRSRFYLAQTYRDLDRPREAIEHYAARAEMGGWDEEVYNALLQVGMLKANLDDWGGGLAALVDAWETRPSRLEAIYELAWRLRVRGSLQTAYSLLDRVVDPRRAAPVPDDILFVQPWVYRYGLLVEYTIAALGVGDHEGALTACDTLLAMDDLPEAYRSQTRANRLKAIDHKARAMAERRGFVVR